MDPIETIRWINFIFSLVAIGGWIYFYRRFREPAAIAPLTWLVNLSLYLSFRLFSLGFDSAVRNTYFLNLWSSLLQTHGILLLAIGVFIAIGRLVNNKTYMDRLAEKLRKEKEK